MRKIQLVSASPNSVLHHQSNLSLNKTAQLNGLGNYVGMRVSVDELQLREPPRRKRG